MPSGRGGERGRRLARLQRRGSTSSASREQFDRLVREAIGAIPEPFRSKMENVAVVVEDNPDPRLLASLGMASGEDLLGLYDGIPLTDRGDSYNLAPPDRIYLFRRPILAICSSLEEIRDQVRLTVLHEVAHYYGIGDDELERRGFA